MQKYYYYKGYPTDFIIYSDGRIYDTQRSDFTKGWKNPAGYVYINIRPFNCQRAVHQIVAETFIPNPDKKKYVNHIDGNKENNYVSSSLYDSKFREKISILWNEGKRPTEIMDILGVGKDNQKLRKAIWDITGRLKKGLNDHRKTKEYTLESSRVRNKYNSEIESSSLKHEDEDMI